MSRCRSCHAPIEWVIVEQADGSRRKRMPIDPEPVVGGNLQIVDRAWDGTAVVRVVEPQPGLPRRVSHFATCPNAADHRTV